MNRPLDHEQCSELLRPYVGGSLSAPASEAVEAHLAGCDRCRAEETIVRELLSATAPLSAAESEGLRTAVLAGLRAPASLAEHRARTSSSPRKWKGARLLAAAALLIGGIVFAGNNLLGSGGLDSAAEDEAGGTISDEPVADIQDRLRFRRPTKDSLSRSSSAVVGGSADSAPLQAQEEPPAEVGAESSKVGRDSDGEGAGGGSGTGAGRDRFSRYSNGPPRPLFVRRGGELSPRRLTLIGRYGLPLVLFPSIYTTEDAEAQQENFLVALANAAETEADSQQILDCGAQVLSQAGPVLPGLATFGEIDGEPVFVLALAWTEAEQGPLNRYMVWTWPRGGCDGIPGYRAGRIGA